MDTDLEGNYLNIELSEQRSMNRQGWLILVQKGYTSDQLLQLDFVFVTGERSNAKRFQAFLQELDYKAQVVNNDDEFEISGKTPEMQLTLEGLQDWTARMVEYGMKYGCTFDGWTSDAIFNNNNSEKK